MHSAASRANSRTSPARPPPPAPGSGALALFGTGLACAVLTGWGLFALDEPYAGYLVAAGAVYLVGDAGLTIAYHVPRNEALARVDSASEEGARVWARYRSEWTRWNHVRTAAGLAAAALLAVALQAG